MTRQNGLAAVGLVALVMLILAADTGVVWLVILALRHL